jgi:glutathione S-transferase
MKLYYAPGACSLADHIALHEGGFEFEPVRVDLKAKTSEDGADYLVINPKGYVPALVLDEGDVVTENIAILDWIANSAPNLMPRVRLARTRLLEALAYISTELHKSFKPFFANDSDDAKAAAAKQITRRLQYLADRFDGDYLFGDTVTVADPYLFVMLLWADKNGIALPKPLPAYRDRMLARPAVRMAMAHEGLLQPA